MFNILFHFILARGFHKNCTNKKRDNFKIERILRGTISDYFDIAYEFGFISFLYSEQNLQNSFIFLRMNYNRRYD